MVVRLLALIHFVFIQFCRARDEEAGEIPVAFVMKRDGCTLSQTDVIDFVSKQVIVNFAVFFRVSLCYSLASSGCESFIYYNNINKSNVITKVGSGEGGVYLYLVKVETMFPDSQLK